jgi:hypothetical protein
VSATFAIETVPTGCGYGGNSTSMTKEELIEAACEIIGGNVKDLSVDQVQKLMTVAQHLSDLSLKEHRSFGNLCAIRATVDDAVTAGGTMNDLVTVRLTKEQCTFLLALVDREIREHA